MCVVRVQANDQAATAAAATNSQCKRLAKFAARFGSVLQPTLMDMCGAFMACPGARTLDIGLCIFMAKLVTFSIELWEEEKPKAK